MARKKQNTFTTLANCIGTIGRNNQRAYNKNLYQQALKESTENKTSVLLQLLLDVVISKADIESYNMKFEDTPMRRDIVFIDELSDLMKMCGKELETYIVRIAQKARACGIHLVIATQYPVASVVTGLVKANMPTKICLRVGTVTNSMVALDMLGGEKLMGQGDMLYLPNGSLKPVRLQAGFVSEVAINNVVCALMKNQ